MGAPPADLSLLLPFFDGNALAGGVGYVLLGLEAAYPQIHDALMSVLTPRGQQMLDWSQHTCLVQAAADYAFRHVQFWFNTDPYELISNQPLKGILDAQRVGTLKPQAPVFISINRWDPLAPWDGAHQLALDWCAKGADVEFWTNEEPPFFNKLDINHLLPYFVDGERAMGWVADRFNGVPTTPNCAQI